MITLYKKAYQYIIYIHKLIHIKNFKPCKFFRKKRSKHRHKNVSYWINNRIIIGMFHTSTLISSHSMTTIWDLKSRDGVWSTFSERNVRGRLSPASLTSLCMELPEWTRSGMWRWRPTVVVCLSVWSRSPGPPYRTDSGPRPPSSPSCWWHGEFYGYVKKYSYTWNNFLY